MDYPDADLNLLYDKSLKFGEHCLRPLTEWAQELCPERDAENSPEICCYIEAVRTAIEDYINSKYDYKAEKMTESGEQIKNWIKHQYPWMTSANILHGYSQGLYYAWHG